jgi:hypothetical protein
MSPGSKDRIGAPLQAGQDKQGIDPAGARHTHYAHVGRILETAYAGQIGSRVTAPVAQKRQYLGLLSFFCTHFLHLTPLIS